MAYDSPEAHSSQPMGFAGRFHPSSAPTLAKPTMNATAATPFATLPCPAPRPGGSGWTWL